MIIPSDTLKEYLELKERHDASKLAGITGLSRGQIYNILKGADCSRSVAMKFKRYYAFKKIEAQQLQDQD